MAISYIASDTQTAASALSLTFSIPAAAQAGDFMLVFVAESANQSPQWWDDDGGGGNGWTLAAWERSQVGQDLESALYYKVHSGTESDPTFTWMTSGTSQPMSGILLVYRGVDTVTPVADITHLHDDNDNNPPNSPVRVDNPNSWVVCFNALTHDDTAVPSPPSGFTMRAQVYGGASQHTEDHRDRFAADISGINTQLRYATPTWLHGVAANISEYHCYTISLNEIHAISISDYDKRFHWGDTNLTITGYGFGATQGTGKVEIWSDYTGTTKVSQTVDSWSDTSIQIATVQGSLGTDQYLYLVVTNDSGEESIRVIYAGFFDYIGEVLDLEPDHWWPLNNNYEDYGRRECYRPMIQSPLGTINLASGAICNDIGYTLSFGTTKSRLEAPDSRYMNVYSTLTERTFAGWIQVSGVDNALSAIYKEGGSVQNLLLATGIGNVLIAQLADTGDIVHSIADVRLTLDRPYHVCIRFSYLEDPKEMRLYVDGRVQSSDLTSGNPLNGTAFDEHTVDITWGDPDTLLQTGGTSISYDTRTDAKSAGWVTFSDLERTNGALDPETEIRDVLFRLGALPKYTISSGECGVKVTAETSEPGFKRFSRQDKYMFASFTPVYGENSSVKEVVVVVRDITEEYKTCLEHRQRAQVGMAVMQMADEISGDGFCFATLARTPYEWTPNFLKILKLQESDIVNIAAAQRKIYSKIDNKEEYSAISVANSDPAATVDMLLHYTGDPNPVRLQRRPIKNPQGELLSIFYRVSYKAEDLH